MISIDGSRSVSLLLSLGVFFVVRVFNLHSPNAREIIKVSSFHREENNQIYHCRKSERE